MAGTSGTGSNRDQSGTVRELHSLMNATSAINEQLWLAVRKLQDGGQCGAIVKYQFNLCHFISQVLLVIQLKRQQEEPMLEFKLVVSLFHRVTVV